MWRPQSKEDLSSFALPHLGGEEKIEEQLNLDQEASGKPGSRRRHTCYTWYICTSVIYDACSFLDLSIKAKQYLYHPGGMEVTVFYQACLHNFMIEKQTISLASFPFPPMGRLEHLYMLAILSVIRRMTPLVTNIVVSTYYFDLMDGPFLDRRWCIYTDFESV